MLQFIAPQGHSFLWKPAPSQWMLRPEGLGQRAAAIHQLPFVIGRAWDCQLLLPSSPELQKTTSRWHCHVLGGPGEYRIVDGSLREVPETGQVRPSVSGTFRNGKRLNSPEALRPGDTVAIGSWTLRVEPARSGSIDIGAPLARMLSERPRIALCDETKQRESFGRLSGLFQELGSAQDTDEALLVIARYALARIPQAEVVAILVDGAGQPETRIAWQRDGGRVRDFRFSTQLVGALPPEEAFLLQPKIAERSASQTAEDITSGLLAPLFGSKGRLGILYLDNRGSGMPFHEADLYLASALASVAAQQLAWEQQLLLARVEQNMRQYFGPEVVRLILERSRAGEPVGLTVQERDATILFVDMQGFSAFCRTRPPTQISELLSPYFELVAQCIQRHGGHVDKFIGDGVLGVFGAQPLSESRFGAAHALSAVRAARVAIRQWGERTQSRWGTQIALRAGINTGKVVVGNIGFPGRLEYSVLGDAVNLAARMEKLARSKGVALTDATQRLVASEFPCVDGGTEEVHGFGHLRVWHL